MFSQVVDCRVLGLDIVIRISNKYTEGCDMLLYGQ